MKAERRDRKHTRLKRKRVKHGYGKWKQKVGISKKRKELIEKKIKIKYP